MVEKREVGAFVLGGVLGFLAGRAVWAPWVYDWALKELGRIRIEVLDPDTGKVMLVRKPLPDQWYAKALSVFRLDETEWVVVGVEDSATPEEEVDYVDIVIKLSKKRGENYFVIDGVSCTGWYPKRIYYEDKLVFHYGGYHRFNESAEGRSPHFELPLHE